MKNSISFVLVIMLFVVSGCSPSGKKEEKIDSPPPPGLQTPNTTILVAEDLTLDKFNEIKNGLTYEEVVKILGSPGNQTRISEIGPVRIVSYKWEGEKFKRVFASFRDNKLTGKSQSGLK